jgi:DDE superfamily endonuclease
MTSENFLEFMKHFEKHAKPTAEHPVLLILDNHCSHISIDVLDYAKEHFITILSFPPHCSHALQPLDRSVFGPLKTYINQAMDNWMRDPQNANKAMTIHVLPAMVSYAFPKAFTPANITAGFRCTGIFPFDRNIFTDVDFMPSSVSDRPLSASDNAVTDVSGAPTEAGTDNPPATPTPADTIQSTLISPEDIRPFARAAARDKTKKPRKSGKSAIYTDTPVKDEIARDCLKKASKSTAAAKDVKKGARKNLLKKFKGRKKPIKKSPEESSEASDEEVSQQMELDMQPSDDDVSDAESEVNVCPAADELQVDDHILVKFTGKKESEIVRGTNS